MWYVLTPVERQKLEPASVTDSGEHGLDTGAPQEGSGGFHQRIEIKSAQHVSLAKGVPSMDHLDPDVFLRRGDYTI